MPSCAEYRGKVRCYVESGVFVAVYMAIGSFFQLGGSGYLLLGIPLVVVFQLFVARRPLHQLWVRNADRLRLDLKTLGIASALAVVPAWVFLAHVRPYGIMFLVIAGGIIPCAFALRHQREEGLLSALPSFGTALVVGCAIFASSTMWLSAGNHTAGFLFDKVPILFADFFCMTLAGFVVEEVIFRGAIDSHILSKGSTRFDQWISAIIVSLLWGLWHLPLKFLYPSRELGFLVLVMILNILWGVPLSFCWRKSGTLLLPSMAHFLCDAYRNVLSMYA